MAYKDKRPIACKPVSNWGGVEIMRIDERDEKVIVRDNYGVPQKAHSARIRYNAKGNPYFKHNGKREYLDDYLRCKN